MSKLENLWYTRCGVPTAVGIAVQLGWIEEEFTRDGIKISSVREASEKNQRQSHYDHSLDNSFRQGGSVPAIWTKANGRATKLVGLTWTDEAQVIFAKPGSDIRSVKDLKGKRLGIASRPDDVIDFWNATTRRVYAIALELAGISEKDVEFVELPRLGNSFDDPNRTQRRERPEDLVEVKALLEGKVDVIFHKGSRGLEIVDAIGGQVIFDTWKDPEARKRANNHSPRTLTVDAHLAENHPDIVARLVKRTLQAGEWADANPQQAIEYVAKETNSSEHWVKAAYGGNVNQNLKTDLEESSIVALQEFVNFLFERGFLPQNFDVRAWIDPRPLAAAKAALGAQQEPARKAPAAVSASL
jgi:ABC-type nitrate/sulfonate/bicarbonate transport system substrate-binding protein